MVHQPTLKSYHKMIERCYRVADVNYANYGGRGIRVCDRWLIGMKYGPPGKRSQGLMNFIADMGERPEGTTLDRPDRDGDYCPENCRWADNSTQNTNRVIRPETKAKWRARMVAMNQARTAQ